MRYATLFSGIEAPTVAWKKLGWKPVFFSETAPFPCAILKRHYPHVPNVGDATKFKEWGEPFRGKVDLIHTSAPCQSYSQMGLREGLAGPTGGLLLTSNDIIDYLDPDWVTFENVPGLLNLQSNPFGQFLGRIVGGRDGAVCHPVGGKGCKWPAAGVVSGPLRTIAWRVLSARDWLPQSRDRVFAVAVRGSRNYACAAALFPVRESLSGAVAPLEEPETDPGTGNTQGLRNSGWQRFSTSGERSLCLNAGGMGRIDFETETHVMEFNGLDPVTLRMLTPVECARIQGFPDDYVLIPWNKKPGLTDTDMIETMAWLARHLPESSETVNKLQSLALSSFTEHYSALGNSIPVPVIRTIGERINTLISSS